MEFLQTAWTALTVGNKAIPNIVCIPITVLEIIVIFFIFTRLFKNSSSKKQKVLYVLLSSILSLISLYIIPTLYNIFFKLVLYPILILFIFKTNKLKQTIQNLENEKLYNKTLTLLYDNVRGFKHDFNNIVQSIGGYITTENMDGLKIYYNELLDDCQKINNLSILNPEIINNPAICSLLASKYHIADELGIKINLEILIDLNSINMKIYELSRILGILIDNAIEASKNCNEKIINISMRNDNKQNRQLIIIKNTYENKEVNVDKIFEKGFTSKSANGNSHGLGLWEVRQILKKNNNLNLHTTKDNRFFNQQLEIYT